MGKIVSLNSQWQNHSILQPSTGGYTKTHAVCSAVTKKKLFEGFEVNTVRPTSANGRVNGRSFSILRHNMVMELSPTYANDDDYDVICYVGMARTAESTTR